MPFPPEGEGWATMTEICEAANRDHQVMRKILRDKKAETRKFRTATADGKTVVTMHYRIVQK